MLERSWWPFAASALTRCAAPCRLLLLRGRLAQSCIELPEGLFDPDQEGDEELMRYALCYNLLQVRQGQGATMKCSRQHVVGDRRVKRKLVLGAQLSGL